MALFSATLAATPGVYYAFQNSDSVGKGIVMLLIFGSVITWATMIDKAVALHRAKKQSERFLYAFRESKGNMASGTLMREAAANDGPIAQVYTEGVERLVEFYAADARDRGNDPVGGMVQPSKLSSAQYGAIEAVLENEVSGQIQELETRIGLLATLVSLCPFLGLFGTVWGVMLAFCGIAAAGKADFSALAPGVSGALLTTVAGLVVAIPSLVGYNFMTGTIRQLTVSMDNFTEEFMARLKLEQLAFDRRAAVSGAAPAQPGVRQAPLKEY